MVLFMKEKIKNLFSKLKNPLNIVIFLITYIIFFSPVWVGSLLFFLSGNKFHLTYATGWATFWSLPFTPAIPIIIVITFSIRKIVDITKNKNCKK